MAKKIFTYPVSVGNSDDFKGSLEWLDEKLNNIQKQVSYFDFYNITGAVSDYNLFSAQVNSLPLNESLVVNTPPFYYNGENYSPGDIVIKNSAGDVHHIKAQTGGVYYPQKLIKTGSTYALQYAFSDSAPTLGNSEASMKDVTEATALFAEKISYKDLVETTSTNIYGFYEKLNESGEYNFEAYFVDGVVVWPFIQFFLCVNDIPTEQIFIDFELELRDSSWYVSVKDYGDSQIYIKVK